MGNFRVQINWCVSIFILLFSPINIHSQEPEDEFAPDPVVTVEMFQELQDQINGINSNIGYLSGELEALAAKIQNLAAQPTTGEGEMAGLQELMGISKKQEEDIAKLFYANGLWKQNFKVINVTFGQLRKVATFQAPVLNDPVITIHTKRIISATGNTKNVTSSRSMRPPPSFQRVIGAKHFNTSTTRNMLSRIQSFTSPRSVIRRKPQGVFTTTPRSTHPKIQSHTYTTTTRGMIRVKPGMPPTGNTTPKSKV